MKIDKLPATFGEIINRAQVNRHAAGYDANPVDYTKTEKSVRDARMVVEAIRQMLKPESRVECGPQRSRVWRGRDGPTARYITHMFAMRRRENGIEHRFKGQSL